MFLSVLSVFRPTSDDIQTRISTAADGTEGLGESATAQFSPDGRYVTFQSRSALVAGDTDTFDDIYLKDLSTGAVTRLSTKADGTQANNSSSNAQFSPDGRFVVFESYANLVAGDTGSISDIFLKDLSTGAITCLSTSAKDVQGDRNSTDAQVSPDGRFVVFTSFAGNLGPSNPLGESHIFLKDLSTGAVTRLSAPQTERW
jgi:Tol biopolymer transport system component